MYCIFYNVPLFIWPHGRVQQLTVSAKMSREMFVKLPSARLVWRHVRKWFLRQMRATNAHICMCIREALQCHSLPVKRFNGGWKQNTSMILNAVIWLLRYAWWSWSPVVRIYKAPFARFASVAISKSDFCAIPIPLTRVPNVAFFLQKRTDFFFISAQKHTLRYLLEAPQRGASNEYQQHMFSCAKRRKLLYGYQFLFGVMVYVFQTTYQIDVNWNKILKHFGKNAIEF